MKKNVSKKSNIDKNSYNHNVFEAPEVIDMDSLSYFDDESLENRHNYLQAEREKITNEGVDALPWEVEICYTQREMKIRSNRRSLHEKYIRSNPDYQYADGDYDKNVN